MRVVGVEPTRLAAQEPKSCASANSTIPAYSSILQLRPNRLNIVSVPAEKVNHCIDISALHSAYYRRTIVSFSMAERGFLPMRRSKLRRAGSIAATYLLVAALAVLGWLWHSLPAEILLEPGQTLTLPRFAYVQPLRTAGSRNAASTQAAGSYQATLSIGGWLPVKTVRALVETRPVVTVCGTPFGVKMFSEGALIVGFSDLNPGRHREPRQEGRAAAGRPGGAHGRHPDRDERRRARCSGNGRRRAGAGGLYPQW